MIQSVPVKAIASNGLLLMPIDHSVTFKQMEEHLAVTVVV